MTMWNKDDQFGNFIYIDLKYYIIINKILLNNTSHTCNLMLILIITTPNKFALISPDYGKSNFRPTIFIFRVVFVHSAR
jgi:hypothetical protein